MLSKTLNVVGGLSPNGGVVDRSKIQIAYNERLM
jgi:hypothetical protein